LEALEANQISSEIDETGNLDDISSPIKGSMLLVTNKPLFSTPSNCIASMFPSFIMNVDADNLSELLGFPQSSNGPVLHGEPRIKADPNRSVSSLNEAGEISNAFFSPHAAFLVLLTLQWLSKHSVMYGARNALER
jgi:hypothetical protein